VAAATASAALESLIRTLTPDDSARSAAARHREYVESWLKSDLNIVRMRETGSWHHGTALKSSSDVDYFVNMGTLRPEYSSTALETLRESLWRMPGGYPIVDRPSVRLPFFDGGPAMEITPAYYRETDDYDIPDPNGTGWIRSNPQVHLDYVNSAQKKTAARAKSLIRLVKAWKLANSVPLSSFYLAMRTAQYSMSNAPIIYGWDLCDLFKKLSTDGLREMNDPTNYGRRIATGCSGLAQALAAKNAVDQAAIHFRLSEEATEAGNHSLAIAHLRIVFSDYSL
jgi:hypothetical protein